MVAHQESAALAERLIAATCEKHEIVPGQLTIHADRGSSMTSKPVAWLLADLGVTRTHSRPHVSNDNPFSEAQFKTLKYRPDFPARFATYEAARAFCHPFFSWYNREHRHGGIGLLTPAMVHYGQAEAVRARRAEVLAAAYIAHPERFVPPPPPPPAVPPPGRPRRRCCPPPSGSTRPSRPTTAPLSLRRPRPLSPSHEEPPGSILTRGGAISISPRNPLPRSSLPSLPPRRDTKCEPSVSQSR